MSGVRVALDAMGGDRAPTEIVAGALAAARPGELEVILVGDEAAIRAALPAGETPGITVRHSTDVITFDDEAASAVRAKTDASLVVCARAPREGWADAAVSAGNTGAMMAAALLSLRRLPGVTRPGLAAVLPGAAGPVTLVDCGANVDTKPDQLHQYAHLGASLAEDVLAISAPRVGLLSIGEEPSKGDQLTRDTFALLAADGGLRFVGNVEGRDLLSGAADVIVADGFTGNVALKATEGTARYAFGCLREEALRTLRGKVAGWLLRPTADAVRRRLDPETYGGAYLLGLQGVAVVAHGSSSRVAIANACRYAAAGVRSDLCGHMAARVAGL